VSKIEFRSRENHQIEFNPFGELLNGILVMRLDRDELFIPNPQDGPDLHMAIAKAEASASILPIVRNLKSGKDDPFSPGDHFVPEPIQGGAGYHRFSVVFLLDRESAGMELFKKRNMAYVADFLMSTPSVEGDFIAVGYATLRVKFTRKIEEMALGEEDAVAACYTGREYTLLLEPQAFFISELFRGESLGVFSGAALGQLIQSGLYELAKSAKARGELIILDIQSYFRLPTKASEPVIETFHSEVDQMSIMLNRRGAETGVFINSFELDHAW
jgi:hypothetical protein